MLDVVLSQCFGGSVKDEQVLCMTYLYLAGHSNSGFVMQATTLDNWSCVMIELMRAPPYCIASTGYHTSSCGVPTSALVYFILIVYIMAHIITNLFIAQIIDTITFGLLNEDAMLSPSHLTNFQALWAHEEFDPWY